MTNRKHTKKALLSSVIALILCCSMLVGTTFAWFTDSVESMNNVITAGNLDIKVTNENGDDIQGEETLFQEVELWEPGVVAYENLNVKNAGTLALQYDLKINFADQNIINETGKGLADVLQVAVVEGVISETERSALTSRTDLEWTLLKDFNFHETLLPDDSDDYGIVIWWEPSDEDNDWNLYDNRTTDDGVDYLHIDLGVNVFATQVPHEEDSFDKWYDLGAVLPQPEVNPWNDKDIEATIGIGGDTTYNRTLDVAYQFLPTQTKQEALDSGYGYWHADFVIKVDRDVPADDGNGNPVAGLAGYYSAWCETNTQNGRWVALEGVPLTANTEYRLVKALGNGSITVNYSEICEYGIRDENVIDGFLCGAWADESLNGMTLTVELRIYETEGDPMSDEGPKNIETGKYYTIGTYTHTFSEQVADSAELKDALNNGISNVTLAAGTYTMPTTNGDVTISGTKDTIISGNDATAKNVTFNGVTIQSTGAAYTGIKHSNEVVYNDVIIVGNMYLYAEKVVFTNCTFDLENTNDYIWVYGATNVEFIDCTFNTQGKAILVFQDGSNVDQTVKVEGCTFNATESKSTWNGIHVAAVSIDGSQGGTYNVILNNNTVDADFNGLWQDKTAAGNITVTVDGSQVLAPNA